jgi:hypothetical protein
MGGLETPAIKPMLASEEFPVVVEVGCEAVVLSAVALVGFGFGAESEGWEPVLPITRLPED